MKTKSSALKPGRNLLAASQRTLLTKVRLHALCVSPVRIKSILVPIDFSDLSQRALDYAVEFARQFAAKLTLVHVVEPSAATASPNVPSLTMENNKLMSARRAQLDRVAKQRSVPAKFVGRNLVRAGRVFNEITKAARKLKVDLIILSTHGYTGFEHACLGSTAERVMDHAPCPVLVVREREHEFLTRHRHD